MGGTFSSNETAQDVDFPPNFEKLMWCTPGNNTVYIYDVNSRKKFAQFQGIESPRFKPIETNIVHIRDTNLLISAGYSTYAGAIEIFDISKRKPKRIFSFCGTFRHITTKDIAYCHKRNLFAVFPTKDSLSYHLFEIQYRVDGIICSLIKKAKQRIDSQGKHIALIDEGGNLRVSDVDSDTSSSEIRLNFTQRNVRPMCRWSQQSESPLVYVSFGRGKLNAFDAEKKVLLFENVDDVPKYEIGVTSMDACKNNYNLLALAAGSGTGTGAGGVMIYDQRVGKAVRKHNFVHSDVIKSIKWSPNGDKIATCSMDKTVKVVAADNGKAVLFKESTKDDYAHAVCWGN